MKIAKLTLTPLLLLILVTACKNPEQLKPEEESNPQKTIIYPSELTDNIRAAGSSAPLGIESVEVEENQMRVRVSYSGGCKQHNFKLVGHKMISKSLPPQRTIKIIHQSNSDDCREIIKEDLTFDITNLAYGKGEIILILDGYSERISYTPPVTE